MKVAGCSSTKLLPYLPFPGLSQSPHPSSIMDQTSIWIKYPSDIFLYGVESIFFLPGARVRVVSFCRIQKQ